MSVTRINYFDAKPGLSAELRGFLQSVISAVRGSPGCRSCEILEAVDHPDQLAIIEVWDGIDSHQAAAGRIPASQIREAMALLATPARGTYFRPLRGADG